MNQNVTYLLKVVMLSFISMFDVMPVQAQEVQVYGSYGTGSTLIRPSDRISRDVNYSPRTFSLGYRAEVFEKWLIGPEVFVHRDRFSAGTFGPLVTIVALDGPVYRNAIHAGFIMHADYLMREGRLQVSGGGGIGLSALYLFDTYAMLPLQMNARVQYNFTKNIGAYITPKLMTYTCLNVGQWTYFSPFHMAMFGEVGLAFRFNSLND